MGGFSNIVGSSIFHPFDLMRIRLQVTPMGIRQAFVECYKKDGIRGFWTGISATILRQTFYGSTKLGTFQTLTDWRKKHSTKGETSKMDKIAIGVCTGAVAGFMGTPGDLVLVRMTADNALPLHQRRKYKSSLHALVRISRQEGVFGLFRGVVPTVTRSMIVNGAQLGTYAISRDAIKEYFDFPSNSIQLTFVSASLAGLAATMVGCPIDVIKSRVQNMAIQQGTKEYSGVQDVLYKAVSRDGMLSLWRGFLPFYLKVAPHTCVSMYTLETFRKVYRDYV